MRTRPKPLGLEATLHFAELADTDALVRLDRQLYGQRALRQSRWEQLLQSPSAVVLVARVRGAVVAFGIAVETRGVVEVQSVGVHKHNRRTGIGSKLLAALRRTAPAATAVVCEENLVAQQWLRANQWRAVRWDRGRYGSRGDGIVFEGPQPQ